MNLIALLAQLFLISSRHPVTKGCYKISWPQIKFLSPRLINLNKLITCGSKFLICGNNICFILLHFMCRRIKFFHINFTARNLLLFRMSLTTNQKNSRNNDVTFQTYENHHTQFNESVKLLLCFSVETHLLSV